MKLHELITTLVVLTKNDPTAADREVFVEVESEDGAKVYSLLTGKYYFSDELFWNASLGHNEKRPAITLTGEDC